MKHKKVFLLRALPSALIAASATFGCVLVSPTSAQVATKLAPLPDDARFASEINQFVERDQQQMPPSEAALFIGSSSARLWGTLTQDFREIPVVNRGFGGSYISDSVDYADRIAIPYKPKLIMMFAGTNDIGNGKSPEQVKKDFVSFADKIHAALPTTRVTFISISPTWARWSKEAEILETNSLIAKWVADNSTTRKLGFLDTHARLLGADGQPRADLLEADNLHLNAKGYALLTSIIKPQILAWADADGIKRLPPPAPIVAPDVAKLDGPPVRDGDTVVFRFRAPANAQMVFLAGSFNGFAKNNKGQITDESFAMSPAGDGLFFKRLPVELKEQKYKYVYTDQTGAFKWVSDPQVTPKDAAGNTILDFAKLRSAADEIALTRTNSGQGGAPLRDGDRVLFRFRPANGADRVYLAGSFNNWANNSKGTVTDRQFQMSPLGNGVWARWMLLSPTSNKYKFVAVSSDGSTRWFADPHVTDKDTAGNTVLDFATIENVKAP